MYVTILCLPIFAAMVFRFFADYLTHRLVAKTRHGTHSPFVYKLTDEVIYDFSAKKIDDSVEQQRKKLFDDDSSLILTENNECLGQLKLQQTTVKRLAKKLTNKKEVDRLIYRLVANRQPAVSLQIGTGLGVSAAYFSMANSRNPVKIIECEPEFSTVAQRIFSNLGIDNVELRTGNLQQLLHHTLLNSTKLDIVYFNKFKDGETLFNLFGLCLAKADENSMFIIKGIYSDPSTKTMWAKIKELPEVTVTVDLFWIGLVYFKKDQAEEHFKIKFPL